MSVNPYEYRNTVTHPLTPISMSPSRPPNFNGMLNCLRFGAWRITSSAIMSASSERPSSAAGICLANWSSSRCRISCCQLINLARSTYVPVRLRVEGLPRASDKVSVNVNARREEILLSANHRATRSSRCKLSLLVGGCPDFPAARRRR